MKHLFLTLLLVTSAQVSAQPRNAPVTELIEAMRVDFVIIDALRHRARRLVDDGLASPTAYDCLLRTEHQVLTQPLADHIADLLTPDEVEAASYFYLRPIGRKFTRAAEINNYRGAALTTEPLPSFTKAEMSEVSRFTGSPAGKKLHAALREIPPSVGAIVDRLLRECGVSSVKRN